MWSNQENRVRKQVRILCEVVAYAMRSSGKTSLAVGLSPYKIAKKDVLASKLAGRFFHHFAWLVAFTNSQFTKQFTIHKIWLNARVIATRVYHAKYKVF